jgi:transcriptional regulator with XRE-family HTH domain
MRIGELIRLWRAENRYGIREAAKLIGVSSATLSRVERGEGMDAQTLAKLLNWIMETTPS